MNKKILILMLLPIVLITACTSSKVKENAQDTASLSVGVYVEPYKFLVDRISDDTVHVVVLTPSNINPHTYSPSPKQIESIGAVDVYLQVGAPNEQVIINKILGINSNYNVVDVGVGVIKREMGDHVHYDDHDEHEDEHEDEDEHEHEDEHHNDELDTHIWLGIDEVIVQIDNIVAILSNLDPSNSSLYKEHGLDLKDEFITLKAKIKDQLEDNKKSVFVVFHPTFGYFADSYHLKQFPIEYQGKKPTLKQLDEIILQIDNVSSIILEPQFSQTEIQVVADILKSEIITINPIQYDLIDIFQSLADAIDSKS